MHRFTERETDKAARDICMLSVWWLPSPGAFLFSSSAIVTLKRNRFEAKIDLGIVCGLLGHSQSFTHSVPIQANVSHNNVVSETYDACLSKSTGNFEKSSISLGETCAILRKEYFVLFSYFSF